MIVIPSVVLTATSARYRFIVSLALQCKLQVTGVFVLTVVNDVINIRWREVCMECVASS